MESLPMNPIAIVQARMGSSRLPGKVLRPIVGKPMLELLVERIAAVPAFKRVVVATSERPGDQIIVETMKRRGIDCFAGSEKDVLDRFYSAALTYKGDPILRVTADCPLVDPDIISDLIEFYNAGEYDYVGVAAGAGAADLDGGRYPDGLDAEYMSVQTLERAWKEATQSADREHVTPYIWRNPHLFRIGSLRAPRDYSQLRWTVDHESDFILIDQIYRELYSSKPFFTMEDILNLLQDRPELRDINSHYIGQEGYSELWKPSSLPQDR